MVMDMDDKETVEPDFEKYSRAINLGSQIRTLRKTKLLTLQQLSQRTGFSTGYLSQIERGSSRITIDGLVKISGELGVPMNCFFSRGSLTEPDGAIVVRAGDRKVLSFNRLGVTEELLSPSLSGPLEVVMSLLLPGATSGDVQYTHTGYEAGVVVKGSLALAVEDEIFELHEGDSFGFDSHRLHRFWNISPAVTQVIWIMTPPTF